MKPRICFLFLFLLMSQAMMAQVSQDSLSRKERRQRETIRYSLTQTGLVYARVYDQRMSQRSYRGIGIQVLTGNVQRRPQSYEEISSDFRIWAMEAPISRVRLYGGTAGFDYRYLRKMAWTRWPRWRWYVGGAMRGFYNMRYNTLLGNSSFHMEWVGALAVSGRAETDVTLPWLGDCTIGGTASLPLLSYVGRLPSYALPGFESPSHAVAPVGDFTWVSTCIDLTRPLNNGNPNILRISYYWDFYAYRDNPIHRLRYAAHALGITVVIRKGKIFS